LFNPARKNAALGPSPSFFRPELPVDMTTIDLDASGWRSSSDFFNALATALKSPEWHGRSIDAFLDTMVWHDDIDGVIPPYTIRIRGLQDAPKNVRDEVHDLRDCLVEARAEHRSMYGKDVDVSIETS
jgi:hypothetical protein